MAMNSNAITKFFIGSGCCPLKMRKPRPAMNAAKIDVFTHAADSRVAAHS